MNFDVSPNTSLKVEKCDANLPLFVNKGHYRWSEPRTLENYSDGLIEFKSVFLVINFTPTTCSVI